MIFFCVCLLQDPVGLLPQHRLVHAHPGHGHVQRDPRLRHDQRHLLQVRRPRRCALLAAAEMHQRFSRNIKSNLDVNRYCKTQRAPPAPSLPSCPSKAAVPCRKKSFPMIEFRLDGGISVLKYIYIYISGFPANNALYNAVYTGPL